MKDSVSRAAAYDSTCLRPRVQFEALPKIKKKKKRMVISLTSCQANSSEKLVSCIDSMKERVALRLSGGSQLGTSAWAI